MTPSSESGTMRGPAAARVSVETDGTVRCLLSFSSQGQGHATTAAQIVADQLGVPFAQVVVSQPDTDETPEGSGTFASRGAVAQQGAAGAAAVTLKKKVLDLAGGLLEASPTDLLWGAGRVTVRGMPDRGVTLAEAARAAGSARLEVTERFDPPGPAFSGAVHLASVEVDADTGRVTVRSYAVVEDCGPVINPMIVEGQVHGAVAAHARRPQGHGRGWHHRRPRRHRQRRRRRGQAARPRPDLAPDPGGGAGHTRATLVIEALPGMRHSRPDLSTVPRYCRYRAASQQVSAQIRPAHHPASTSLG